MAEPRSVRFIEQDAANKFEEALTDHTVRQVIQFGITTVLLHRGMNPTLRPEADFDLRFFAEALKAMVENPHRALQRILQGEDLSL